MDFLRKTWFLLVIIAVLAYILIGSDRKLNEYKENVKQYKLDIEAFENIVETNLKTIDSLKSLDDVIINEIDSIKYITNEKIKFVDTLSISDIQSFYSNRYKE